MKNLKKIISIIISTFCILLFSGCGELPNNDDSGIQDSSNNSSVANVINKITTDQEWNQVFDYKNYDNVTYKYTTSDIANYKIGLVAENKVCISLFNGESLSINDYLFFEDNEMCSLFYDVINEKYQKKSYGNLQIFESDYQIYGLDLNENNYFARTVNSEYLTYVQDAFEHFAYNEDEGYYYNFEAYNVLYKNEQNENDIEIIVEKPEELKFKIKDGRLSEISIEYTNELGNDIKELVTFYDFGITKVELPATE